MTKAETNGWCILASIPVILLSSQHFLLDADSNVLNGLGVSLSLIVMLVGVWILYISIAAIRVKWLRKSAEKGNTKAQYLLGHRLLRRKRQSKSVVKCYTKATEEEHSKSELIHSQKISEELQTLFLWAFVSVISLYFFLEPVLNALSYTYEPVLGVLSVIGIVSALAVTFWILMLFFMGFVWVVLSIIQSPVAGFFVIPFLFMSGNLLAVLFALMWFIIITYKDELPDRACPDCGQNPCWNGTYYPK